MKHVNDFHSLDVAQMKTIFDKIALEGLQQTGKTSTAQGLSSLLIYINACNKPQY